MLGLLGVPDDIKQAVSVVTDMDDGTLRWVLFVAGLVGLFVLYVVLPYVRKHRTTASDLAARWRDLNWEFSGHLERAGSKQRRFRGPDYVPLPQGEVDRIKGIYHDQYRKRYLDLHNETRLWANAARFVLPPDHGDNFPPFIRYASTEDDFWDLCERAYWLFQLIETRT